jgi:hypothetical protein
MDEIIGNHQWGYDVTDQLLTRYFTFIRYWTKIGRSMRQCIGYSQTSRKHMIQL